MGAMEAGMPWNEKHMEWLVSHKDNHLVKANSLEEMAEKNGMHTETFVNTVSRYNNFCANRKNKDFGKDPDYLLPIVEAPFYAVKTFLMSDGASGGMFITDECQVKGANGRPMKGLFASGDMPPVIY